MSSTNANMKNANKDVKPPTNNKTNANASKSTNAKAIEGNAKNAATNVNGEKKDNKLPMIIIIVVTVLLFIFVILYITFAMKSKNLKGKVLLRTPIRIDQNDTPIQINNADIPKAAVGREYSYSFWMYLEKFTPEASNPINPTPMHKLVFYRGNANEGATANPIVFVDGMSNKLYIVIKTTESSISSPTLNSDINEIIANNYFLSDKPVNASNKHLICSIDYIPLQRWVNIAFVIDNKVITLYLDGEIYSVKSVDEFRSLRGKEFDRLGRTVNYNLIIEKTDGDIFIGKSAVGNKRTYEGFMGKMEYFNYALSMEQVKTAYASGPYKKGFLSMLGLGQYGLRAPIYKLNQTVQ